MSIFLKDINLKGKTALITGATKGLGRGSAIAIAEAGGNIIAIGRNQLELDSLKKEIKKLKFKCIEVSEFTNSPEILEGRVKTLHPKIHAGILNKRKSKIHLRDIRNNNFENIDLVIVNFYPFEKTLKNTKNHEKIIENIDVGGPTMVDQQLRIIKM